MDLTKNTSAFGLIDEADREALKALPNDQVELYIGGGSWVDKAAGICFADRCIYRQKPEPPKPVVETREGEAWGATYAHLCPSIFDTFADRSVHGTYRQTTIDGKPVRITWNADDHTPELTDEQVNGICMTINHGFGLWDKDAQAALRAEVREYFAAITKAGVM